MYHHVPLHVCREVEDVFCQVSEYKDADDLETLRGIQVPLNVHIMHASTHHHLN